MEGKPITIGIKACPGDPEPRTFYVPPKIRTGTLRRTTAIIEEIAGIDDIPPPQRTAAQTQAWFDAHLRATCEVLRRNYPELTPRDLEDLVDCDQVKILFQEVLTLAGKKVDEQGEAASP